MEIFDRINDDAQRVSSELVDLLTRARDTGKATVRQLVDLAPSALVHLDKEVYGETFRPPHSEVEDPSPTVAD